MTYRPVEDAAIANIEFEQRLFKDLELEKFTDLDLQLWDEDRRGLNFRVIAARYSLTVKYVIRRLKLITSALLLIERGYFTEGVPFGSR